MTIDSVPYEPLVLQRFVDRYIVTRAHAVSDANRLTVEAGIERYPGRFPTSRMRLERFLDRYLGVASPHEPEPALAYYAAPRRSDDDPD